MSIQPAETVFSPVAFFQPGKRSRAPQQLLNDYKYLSVVDLTTNRVLTESSWPIGTAALPIRSGVRTDKRSEDGPEAHLSGRFNYKKV